MIKRLPSRKRRITEAFSLIAFIAALFICECVFAQNIGGPDEHVIHVKFKQAFEPTITSNKIARFGLKPLDQFNQRNNASSVKRLFPDAGKFEQAHRAFGLHLWYEIRIPNDRSIEDMILQYKSFSYFESVEERKEYKAGEFVEVSPMVLATPTHDPFFGSQWHFKNSIVPGADISLTDAWKIETGNRDVIVAVIDGGIDATHPDLHDAMWVNRNEIPENGIDDDQNGYVDDVHGYNFGDNTSTIYANKHATHVGGTIGAITNNGIGVAGIAGGSGSADGVRLMNCVGFGITNDGGFESAMVYAADNGAVISQNSWGGGSSAIEAAIDYFIARAGMDNTNASFDRNVQTGPMAGGIVIFAAGNSNSDDPAAGYPASLDKVIAVASTDIRDDRSTFSNYGSWVDISAPGSGVFSTFPEYNGSYGAISGTSMACPHVSGAAALIVSKYKGTSLRPSFVRTQLLRSCDHVPAAGTGLLGAGRLNAARALFPIDVTPPGAITDLHYEALTQNAVTLSWTAPGSDGQTGTASKYDARLSIYPITEENFTSWNKFAGEISPAAAGNPETYVFPGVGLAYPEYFIAIKAIDFFGNAGPISNILHITVPVNPAVLQAGVSSITQDVYAGSAAVAQLSIANIAAAGAADLTIRAVPSLHYEWLKTDLKTVTVHPGSSVNVPLYFNAGGDIVSPVHGQLVISDPTNYYSTPTVIDITMNVIPASSFELDTYNIAFGNTFVLHAKDTFIRFYNKGNLPLHIGAITSTNPIFSATASQSVIPAGMDGTVKITITPSDLLQQNGIITILSDDPDNASVVIKVSGKGMPAPAATSSVASIDISLNPGEHTILPITLSNIGDANLNWRASINAPGNYTQTENEVFAVGEVTARARSPVEMLWLTSDPYSGYVYAMGQGGMLYLYKPALNNWTALSASPRSTIMNGVYMNDKIYSFSSDTPKVMVVYGISDGKWESIPVNIDVTNVTSDGTSLYTYGVGKLYRWDTSDTWTQLASYQRYSVDGMAYYKGVIYAHMDRGFSSSSNTGMLKYFVDQNTWQQAAEVTENSKGGMAFDPSAKKYYAATVVNNEIAVYDLDTDTWSKETGTQFGGILSWVYTNSPGSSGVYMGRVYGDFTRIETASSLPWISVTPSAGNLAVNETQKVNVLLDAATLTGGVYRGSLKFASTSNSDVNAFVPVKLTVTGVPNLIITDSRYPFGFTFLNEQGVKYIELSNTGNALLQVTSITSDNPSFTTDISSVDLQPGQRRTLTVYFNPLVSGTQLATFTFASNDLDQPLMTFNTSASGGTPPVIGLSPSSLNVTAFAGSFVKADVLVSNTGGSNLEIAAYGLSPSTYWLSGSDWGALVPPGTTRVIQAQIRANLPPGSYTDNLAVSHHYDRFQTSIPVNLTVVSAPGISGLLYPDFGWTYVNEYKTINATLWNAGDQDLIVSAVNSADPRLIVGNYNITVSPGQSFVIPISFKPSAVGDFNSQITITSNDPDDGVFIFPISGTAVTRPHAVLDASSITAGLFSGDVVTKHIMLKNTGGAPLTWSASPQFNSDQNTWMSMSPVSGTIAPGDQTDISVGLNMQGLSTGNFSGNITFTTNADNNNFILPVTMNAIDTSPILQGDQVVEFVGIAQHKTSSKWNIKNTGLSDLTWRFTSVADDITATKAGGKLAPGQTDVITFYLDRLPQAGTFYNSFRVKAVETNKDATFTFSASLSPNRAPDLSSFQSNVNVRIKDDPLRISLSSISDPEGDRFAVATAAQFPAIAEVSISNNFLVVKPVSLGSTAVALAARDAYGAQTQTTFNVIVSPGSSVTGLEATVANAVFVVASPNPFERRLTVKFDSDGSMPTGISMYDSNGRTVWTGESTSGEVIIENENLAAGIYLIKVTRGGKWYGAARVVKQ